MRKTTATPNINIRKGKDADQFDTSIIDTLTFAIHEYRYPSCVSGETRNRNLPTF